MLAIYDIARSSVKMEIMKPTLRARGCFRALLILGILHASVQNTAAFLSSVVGNNVLPIRSIPPSFSPSQPTARKMQLQMVSGLKIEIDEETTMCTSDGTRISLRELQSSSYEKLSQAIALENNNQEKEWKFSKNNNKIELLVSAQKINKEERATVGRGMLVAVNPTSYSTATSEFELVVNILPDATNMGVDDLLVTHLLNHQLNQGSRMSQFRVDLGLWEEDQDKQAAASQLYQAHGFVPLEEGAGGQALLQGDAEQAASKYQHIASRAEAAALEAEGEVHEGDARASAATALNTLGRVQHSLGMLQEASDAYTKALEFSPESSTLFRNLGSVYHSQGQQQMALASYQQAIEMDHTDVLTYFKMGLLYEDLAVGKWSEGVDHAIKCLQYYLDNQPAGTRPDTDVLTRLGNLQLKQLHVEDAIVTYGKALDLDGQLHSVWHNLATAQLKLGQKEEAKESLEKVLALKPDLLSAKHLLDCLTQNPDADTMDPKYVTELFDYYSEFYDDHMRRQLLYSAPRILRQVVRDSYNETLQTSSPGADVLQHLNSSLDILDLGCGTGLSGAWFKDYAKTLVGVDISEGMVAKAQSKMLYSDLHTMDIVDFLENKAEPGSFDLILGADVLGYLGNLDKAFAGAARVLRPGGKFAFTVEEFQGKSERGYDLNTSARFAFTRAYLDQMAKEHNLEAEKSKNYSQIVEMGEPVPGFMYMLQKKE